jgi:hypothetical protein
MKKILFILLAAFISGMVLSSCKSSSSCAAYGETQKYQRETRY